MKTVFIYALKCPETGQIRYVGKSINPACRFRAHLCVNKKDHRTNWIKSLAKRGLKPALEIVDEVPESEWQQWEVAYIEFFREQDCKLTNLTPGGEAGPIMDADYLGEGNPFFGKKHTLASRAKISAGNKGKIRSGIARERYRTANLGVKNPMFGKVGEQNHFFGRKHTAKTIEKMSAVHKARHARNKKNSLDGRPRED